ncbi:MAG: linear amide C-N hydrolase [Chlamydiales bacterium]
MQILQGGSMRAMFFLSLSLLLVLQETFACTGIKLTAKDGSIIHGRTLEFAVPLETAIAVIPRGYAFTGTTPAGPGLAYSAKYAAVGTIVFDRSSILDGLNEKGLSVGTFYFSGFAEYAKVTEENRSYALSPLEFSNWILTQFATVAEVKAALSRVCIASTADEAWGSVPPPFHYIVYDKTGNCLVIEPLKGALAAYDNKLGILTNSPSFDWHMTNLRNYINLRAENAPPLKLEGIELAPLGQGTGMVGLPGDFTPTSRFVRAAMFSYTALPTSNAKECVLQLFHLLNQFDIPKGVARDRENGAQADYTMATCVRDPQALSYYFKTYEDQTIRMVNLRNFDLNAKQIKKVPTSSEQPILEISSLLR